MRPKRNRATVADGLLRKNNDDPVSGVKWRAEFTVGSDLHPGLESRPPPAGSSYHSTPVLIAALKVNSVGLVHEMRFSRQLL